MISGSLTYPQQSSGTVCVVNERPPAGRVRAVPAFGIAVLLLAVVGGIVPVLFAWHFGALGIPRNDDWAYVRAAFRLADSGTFSGGGWAGMNLVGQLVLSLPVIWLFGNRVAALQIEVAALGVFGLLATFDLAKQLLRPRQALFVAALVATSPMWATLSASYMTDLPGFALAMACLALGARGVAPGSARPGYLCASLAVGFVAFTVRENAIVAPLAVGGVAMWSAPRRRRVRLSSVVAVTTGVLVAAAAFYVWRRNLPGFIDPRPQAPSLHLVDRAARDGWQSALLLAVLVSPAVLLADPLRLLRASWMRAAWATAACGGAIATLLGGALLLYGPPAGVVGPGDYVLPNGSLGTEMLAGSRLDLVPTWLLVILAGVGAVSLIVLSCAAGTTLAGSVANLGRRRLETTAAPAVVIIMLAASGYAVSCVIPLALGYSKHLFDRYLLLLVPLVSILVLRSGARLAVASRVARLGGAVMFALVALVGAAYGANSASFDGAKWAVASRAEKLAGSPTRVDGGHIWNDYAARRHVRGPLEGACIALRAESRLRPRERVIAARSVWGPTGTQAWVVARQLHSCREP